MVSATVRMPSSSSDIVIGCWDAAKGMSSSSSDIVIGCWVVAKGLTVSVVHVSSFGDRSKHMKLSSLADLAVDDANHADVSRGCRAYMRYCSFFPDGTNCALKYLCNSSEGFCTTPNVGLR